MELTEKIVDIIENADGKALATMVPGCLHVVPVSTVKVVNNQILLVNYFMTKTLENILENPKVSLAAWRGLAGYQIKGVVEYVTEGETFDLIVEMVADTLPDRVVKGVLVLTPEEVYDVTATKERPGERIM
ncbi:pyridoxamine 5'-phosphate oxidase family protein [Candidatus Nomurabacteria bacterium]|mgnify:CR=1 FL=1|nr:pyridoxamine 5'-phosphate oxidase family protein [Candidatus Kaiserbacteria bacterium]MCB9815156.1 pyridoxamine 5'-phosphate oxidase family protein [Candidatus Nomurabacteria bacterium]